ncbi:MULTISPECIES: Bax inhibitor-1/YccA family protein [Pedobacter]|uniref:Bax inhibitor-1/YccA family protein n=1 Tax=Pedobacter TaxID=84567 RepID=UPI00210A37AA|nr:MULTISPECIES: Bax inhibitor-1/YccA family protein [unclassified Pedobacter]
MENNNNYNWTSQYTNVEDVTGKVAKKFFANVFLWMFVALSLSTFAAYYFANTPELLAYMFNPETGKMAALGWVAMFAPLGLVLLMSAGMSRLSYGALLGVFVLYSALTGVSLSFILLAYTASSVVSCFAAAAGIFGLMAFLGYTTDIDLSRFGSILMIGLVGLIIASIVNAFIQSESFSLFLAFIGIAIFTALTAYDVQKLKRIGAGLEESGARMEDADTKKLAIMGALSLYLDFLNIFLYLLRIFGDRR